MISIEYTEVVALVYCEWLSVHVQLKGSMKEPNISIFFPAHHSMVFFFQCSVFWWKESVRF